MADPSKLGKIETIRLRDMNFDRLYTKSRIAVVFSPVIIKNKLDILSFVPIKTYSFSFNILNF
jgi:mRNA-degrading endonuclease toxin of MazEF toxin-antitoxin module